MSVYKKTGDSAPMVFKEKCFIHISQCVDIKEIVVITLFRNFYYIEKYVSFFYLQQISSLESVARIMYFNWRPFIF